MSYGFGILFKQVNSKAEAMEFALKVTNSVRENALEMLEKAKYFIPSHVNFCEPENKEADKEWLYSCFTNCFTYWPKYQLLGMFETSIPYATRDMFDACISFQNSTDQDYDYEDWKGISCFEKICESVQSMTKEELLTVSASYWNSDLEDEQEMEELRKEILRDEEYYRKSAVYRIIFNELDLDTWMDDEAESESFIRFNLCAINGGNTFFHLCTLLRGIKYEFKKEME